jgi:hypothetical protein
MNYEEIVYLFNNYYGVIVTGSLATISLPSGSFIFWFDRNISSKSVHPMWYGDLKPGTIPGFSAFINGNPGNSKDLSYQE